MTTSRRGAHPRSPRSMAARRARIAQLLEGQDVATQEDLRGQLALEGFEVSQGTLSRDLDAIGAYRQARSDGTWCYVLREHPVIASIDAPAGALARVAADVLIAAEAAQNIAVLRTPPGAAQYLAGALDRSASSGIVGTVAGDDTVLAVMRSHREAADLCEGLLAVAGGGQAPAQPPRFPSRASTARATRANLATRGDQASGTTKSRRTS